MIARDHDRSICKPSMDGRGTWRDNVLCERVWRSVKQGRGFLKMYDNVNSARADIAESHHGRNTGTSHSSPGDVTPEQVYLV